VASGTARFGPLAGEIRGLHGALLGMARRLSRPLGRSQALHLRQEAVAPRTRHPLRASLPRVGQLAPRPTALGQLLEAGLLAQPVPMLALATIPRLLGR
jgi:hypothetical protein